MNQPRHLRVVDGGLDAEAPVTGATVAGEGALIKVAFASSDRRSVDQHFGAAEAFVIFGIDMNQWRLIGLSQFGKPAMDGNEDKLAGKIAALDGCVAVYANAIGASAVNQLKARGVQPMKVVPGAQIVDLIASLQEELIAGPSVWLARAIRQQQPVDPDRFAAMEAEGWEE